MARKDTQFRVGNPGRPRGSKNKISKEYLASLADDFEKHGVAVIEKVRRERPDVYLKLVAQLVPRDIDMRHTGDLRVQVVSFLDVKPEDLEKDVTPEERTLTGSTGR